MTARARLLSTLPRVLSNHGRLLRSSACMILLATSFGCGSTDVEVPKNILSLEGTISDGNSSLPLSGAVVLTGSFVGTSYTPRRIAGSDAMGRYSIDDECAGNDYLQAQAPGYVTATTTIDCAPQRRTVDIVLRRIF